MIHASGGDAVTDADRYDLADSDWSEVKTFNVCPMDIDNNGDRIYLSLNWLREAGAPELYYPTAKAADTVFAEYESAGLDVDLNVF